MSNIDLHNGDCLEVVKTIIITICAYFISCGVYQNLTWIGVWNG